MIFSLANLSKITVHFSTLDNTQNFVIDFPLVSAYTENSKKGWFLNAQEHTKIVHRIKDKGTRKLTRAFLQAIIS